MTDADPVEVRRLRWRCRRGMRELDVLLAGYLDRCWPSAPADQRAAFRALLELPDPELAALCFGLSAALEPGLRAVLAELGGRSELSAAGAVYRGDFGRERCPERDL